MADKAHLPREASAGVSVPPDGAPSLPLFYQRPVALSAADHAALSYVATGTYGFARHANAIPLNVAEFTAGMRYYPIVFSSSTPATPLAIVGVSENENLFVDDGGRWLEGVYVPAYVRRYPFLFIENPAAEDFTLGIDEAADGVQVGRSHRLFRDGKPSELADKALSVCSEYQLQFAATREFCDLVEAARLLVDKEAGLEMKSGSRFRVTDFRIVDEEKFRKLAPKTFLQFRRRGWLQYVYLHLVSTANWATLTDLKAKRGAAPG